MIGLSKHIRAYESGSRAYNDAYGLFTRNTDQKIIAGAWLTELIKTLPNRKVFIDVGAANGMVTSWIAYQFIETITVEPNPTFRAALKERMPSVKVIPENIAEAHPEKLGDLVLCSHVFFHIESAKWLSTLEQLVSWISEEGVLILVLQNRGTDCMRMLRHFATEHSDLLSLAKSFQREYNDQYDAELVTVPSRVYASEPITAVAIAEFMVNCLPVSKSLTREELDEYVNAQFWMQNRYVFSCHQDFLCIRRKGGKEVSWAYGI